MDINSSKTITEFIDLTILNTPKPQASSTVERKGVYSYRLDKTSANNCDPQNNINSNEPLNMDVPTRDTDVQSNSSNRSSISSLGILSIENFEDINGDILMTRKETDNTQRVVKRKSNINETLAMQRLLAQRAMEKVDSKAKGTVGGLPSYLLKPTQTGANYTIHTATPTKNESTINLSDFERSMPPKISNTSSADKISFEVKEISARSSSLGNQNDKSPHAATTIDLRSPSPLRGMSNDFASKRQDIYEQLRQSDASLTALCNRSSQMDMRTQPLGSLSLPDFDTVDLSSTRTSWINAQQDSLVAKLQNELFTPAELAGDKLLADEMSWRKAKDILPTESDSSKANNYLDMSCFSGYIGDGDISLKSRSNEKVSISEFFRRRTENVEDLELKSSPEKKHEPVPLINLTNSCIMDDEPLAVGPEERQCRMSTSSVLSVSQIADILAKMNIQETPTRALNLLLKKSTQNIMINTPSTISSDGSTLKNTRIIRTLSPDSRDNSTLKENSHTNGGSIKSPRRSGNEAVLRDMTNVRRESSDGEWTDAKPNIVCTVDNNGTVSSVAESPSYSCSELEFSDDERTCSAASRLSDEWLDIDKSKLYKLYVDVSQNVPITLISKTNHWLHVQVSVNGIISHNLGDDIVKIDILNNEGLLKPFVTEQFVFKVTSLVTGKFKVVIKIQVSNVVTRVQQILEHIIIIEAEEPKIKVLNEILDFKLNPEGCIKTLMLPITNESSTSLTISLTIVQEYEWVFVFDSDTDAENKAECNRLLTIPAGSTVSIAVDMRCLALEDLGVAQGVDSTTVVGCLRMQLVDSIKLLHQIHLVGQVGFTKVQFKTSCMPFVLLPGQTKSMQVRNSGVVSLELSVAVSLPDTESSSGSTTDNVFTVDTSSLKLKPGQMGIVNITFNARDKLRSVKRMIRLEYPRGPSFVLPIEGVLDSRSPDVKMGAGAGVSPRRDRPGSGSSGSRSSAGSLHTLPDGKLPIESTRTELVWGCVRPGRTNTQDFVLRNRCSQRVRLQAVIHGSQAFKFVKDHSDNMTTMNLVLHAMESRTISVTFCPSSKGAVCARLMFLPIEQETSQSKRQIIQLYGYGGNIAVDVQKVAKDTSGRMWLSFGRLDYRDTLHQMFILRNTGSLTAFACLSVTCKVLYPFMDSSVTVFPTEAVIEPNKEIEISVNFSPRPEDFKYIQKTAAVEVSEIASIKILTGPEPTRGRIRRLFNKLNSSNGGSGVMGQLTSAFVVPRLSGVFPGERIPSDVATCREGGGALRDLLRDVDTRDLALTVERAGPDCTAAGEALDNTLMFQSLVVADTTVMSVTGRASGGFCSVEPRRLTLSHVEQGVVLVRSHHSRPMPFEVCMPAAAAEAGLVASPLVGVLPPGDAAAITVFCTSVPPRLPFTCVLMIYVENEVMEIELKIQNIQSRRS